MLLLCQPCCLPSPLSNFSLPTYNLMLYLHKSFILGVTPQQTPRLCVNARVWAPVRGAAKRPCRARFRPVPAGSGRSRAPGSAGRKQQRCWSRLGDPCRAEAREQTRAVERWRKGQGRADGHHEVGERTP